MILTREILEQYIALQREIKRIEKKLTYYKTHELVSEHGVVTGSMKQFPYAEKHFVLSAPNIKSNTERNKRIRQLMIDLESKRLEYEQLRLDIDIAIEEIADMETRQIVQLKFMEGWTDFEIAEELGYERSTISKRIATFTQITI